MFLCKLSFSNLCTAMAWQLEKKKSFRRIDRRLSKQSKKLESCYHSVIMIYHGHMMLSNNDLCTKKKHATRILKSLRLKTFSDEEVCLLQGVFTLVRHVETNEVALSHKWQTKQPCLQTLKVQMPTFLGTTARLKSYNFI